MVLRSVEHGESCAGGCSDCGKAKRLITAAITARIDATIACLEQKDLPGAEFQATALQVTVDQMPSETAALLAKETLLEVRRNAAEGLLQLKNGTPASALKTFQSALKSWLLHYSIASRPVRIDPPKTDQPAN